MIEINGKQYEVNLDIRWGTQKIMRRIENKPDNPDNMKYMEHVLKDILIPSPSAKEIMNFRRSDIERIFNEFAKDMKKTDSDFKKKRSR